MDGDIKCGKGRCLPGGSKKRRLRRGIRGRIYSQHTSQKPAWIIILGSGKTQEEAKGGRKAGGKRKRKGDSGAGESENSRPLGNDWFAQDLSPKKIKESGKALSKKETGEQPSAAIKGRRVPGT